MGTEPDEITSSSTIVWSEGLRLAATIVAPARRDGLLPAILLCHGWGGVQAHLLELYAGYFARAGYVVMTFDYRTWGDSDGKPVPVAGEPMLTERGERTLRVRVMREVIDPVDLVTDARAAFAYLAGEAGVDTARLGLFGTSYGAGHVLCLAGTDERVRAVVSQIGGYGHPARPEFVEPARKMATDKARGAMDPPIPQREPGPVTGLRGAADMARQLYHAPLELARRVRVPTLFLDAEFEEYNQNDPELQGRGAYEIVRQNAVSERHTFPCSHYRVYDEYLEPARELALKWFSTHL